MLTDSELCQQAKGKKLHLPSIAPEPITIENAEEFDGTILITGRTALTTLNDQPITALELEKALEEAATNQPNELIPGNQFFLLVESVLSEFRPQSNYAFLSGGYASKSISLCFHTSCLLVNFCFN